MTPKLVSWAIRAHDMDAMKAFYGAAFGATFEARDIQGIQCEFGEAAGLTIKLVPLRKEAEFEAFPLHQPGFEVEDVEAVIELAKQHGGRQEGELVKQDGTVHGAVRDPDGNTIELVGPA